MKALTEQPFHNWLQSSLEDIANDLQKDDLIRVMQREGFPCRPFFYPLSMQPPFKHLIKNPASKNPVAYDISARGINLPSPLNITDQQIVDYSRAVRKCIEQIKEKEYVV